MALSSFTVLWRVFSTVEDVQYCRGYHLYCGVEGDQHCRGYDKYCGVIPTVLMMFLHCADCITQSTNGFPTVLNTLKCTDGIP